MRIEEQRMLCGRLASDLHTLWDVGARPVDEVADLTRREVELYRGPSSPRNCSGHI